MCGRPRFRGLGFRASGVWGFRVQGLGLFRGLRCMLVCGLPGVEDVEDVRASGFRSDSPSRKLMLNTVPTFQASKYQDVTPKHNASLLLYWENKARMLRHLNPEKKQRHSSARSPFTARFSRRGTLPGSFGFEMMSFRGCGVK